MVYKLTTGGTLTPLASFHTGSSTGEYPLSPPVEGTDGNLYGTTDAGGDHSSGIVYRVSTAGAFSQLHSFGGDNGSPSLPRGGLVRGTDGNFYGTSYDGGIHGDGALFAVTTGGAVTKLYSLNGGAGEGTNPSDRLVQGTDGNFYGTTYKGGANGSGAVFEMTPAGVLTTLCSLGGTGQGTHPYGGLVQGTDGNFYGATHDGGANGEGTVFRVTPGGTLTTLHSFAANGSDGANPHAALVQGQNGNFYGSTEAGGANGDGTIFEITPAGVLTTVYSFSGSDGSDPQGALLQTTDGSLYGTTSGGGANGEGTVFRLTLHPGFFTGQSALGNGVYYLAFSNGNYFGYYSYLTDPHYIYHFDLGYEYLFDAADGHGGVYLYDFKSQGFFYSSPVFPFPYLYDFTLNTVLYYYPDPSNPGHYNTDGYRFFYRFDNGQIIVK